MGDGNDSGSHIPWQAHERADHYQDGHPEQVQVITCPFLTGDKKNYITSGSHTPDIKQIMRCCNSVIRAHRASHINNISGSLGIYVYN